MWTFPKVFIISRDLEELEAKYDNARKYKLRYMLFIQISKITLLQITLLDLLRRSKFKENKEFKKQNKKIKNREFQKLITKNINFNELVFQNVWTNKYFSYNLDNNIMLKSRKK